MIWVDLSSETCKEEKERRKFKLKLEFKFRRFIIRRRFLQFKRRGEKNQKEKEDEKGQPLISALIELMNIFQVLKRKKKVLKKKKAKAKSESESDSDEDEDSDGSGSGSSGDDDPAVVEAEKVKAAGLDDLERKLRERAISSMKKKS